MSSKLAARTYRTMTSENCSASLGQMSDSKRFHLGEFGVKDIMLLLYVCEVAWGPSEASVGREIEKTLLQ